ncbi:ROK family protein [Actinokineospora sp. 24-640]
MPRAAIAPRLNLSRPTLSRVTRTLADHGLLVDGGRERLVGVGRPLEILEVRAAAHHFLGVKLTGDRLYAALTDLTSSVVATESEALTSVEPGAVVRQIARVVRRFPGFTGLGVTVGGVVRDGVVSGAGFLDWDGEVRLAEALQEATGVPTAVDNDVQALTAAVHWFGAGVGVSSMVLITVGAGVGTGLVVDGRVVRGARGLPPRFAHLLVDPVGGPECGYGHRGCVSSFLMTHVILRRLGGRVSYEEAVALARAGDPEAVRVFTESGYALGALIGHAANFLDPERVLLTGEGLPLYEVATEAVERGMADVFEGDAAAIHLVVQPFDFGEWARSAAILAIRAVITGTSP